MTPWLVFLVACAPAPEPPRLDSVVPEWGWQGESTDIHLSGDRFFPDVLVSTADVDGGRVDADFEVWLETPEPARLDAVELLDYHTLSAEVPEGLPVGVYDVRVVTPSGLEATLASAFSVTETRADHLAISVDDAGLPVTSAGTLHLKLEDPDHNIVAEALPVELRATSALGAAGVQFLGGLDGAAPLPGEIGISGSLDPDGTATVLVASSIPDDVTFTLTGVEPSVVDPDSLLVSWEAGALTRVEVVLPAADFAAEAGEGFEVDLRLYDRNGNELGPQAVTVYLRETCGDFIQEIDLAFEGPWPVTLTRACPENTLETFGLGSADGVSAAFPVLAAPQSGLAVIAYPDPIVAGTGLLLVQVDAVDAYGNILTDASGSAVLHDSAGGVDVGSGRGDQSCGEFDDGRLLCTARPVVAADGVWITARDVRDFTGDSNPINILPDAPVRVAVSIETSDGGDIGAGTPFQLRVEVFDAWNNAVSLDSTSVSLLDDTGTLDCDSATMDEGAALYACTVTYTTPEDVIQAEVLGLFGEARSPVVNGALAAAEVEVLGSTFSAGQNFGVTVTGYDAYGNLYTNPTSGWAFEVVDTTDAITPSTAYLDGDGETSFNANITVAAENVVVAVRQLGVTLGESEPFAIVAGPMAAIDVEVPPWLDVASGGEVVVTARDTYGNPVPSFQDAVTLTPTAGVCVPMEVTDFTAGRAVESLECPNVGFQESLGVTTAAGDFGETDSFDVLDFSCADGPVADLHLNGSSEVVACIVSGSAVVTADGSGTTAGATSVSVWHLADDGSQSFRSSSNTQEFTYIEPGTHRITLVAADSRGCAGETSALAYIGEDDGTPTGPVTLTPRSASVPTTGSTTVDVVASDCAGDVAAFGVLRVRADLGEVGGVATGAGYEVTLDGWGLGAVAWSFPEGYAGNPSFYVTSSSGSAQGHTTLTVTGDSARPEVAAVTPSGWVETEVGEVVIDFTDPMRSLSLVASNITLIGPGGAESFSIDVSTDLRRTTLTLDEPLDPTLGVWTLQLADQVRDSAGNRLSGDYTGSVAAYTVTFGDVPDTLPTVSSCTTDRARFTPDGDDGSGTEADQVTVTPVSSAPPHWWWLEVEDEVGTRVRSAHLPGTDAGAAWDGRGDDGILVDPGTYTVRLYAVDDSGTADVACKVEVVLAQHVVVL